MQDNNRIIIALDMDDQKKVRGRKAGTRSDPPKKITRLILRVPGNV